MRKSAPGLAREKTIRLRQDPPDWGPGYTPGQLATREEAPDYSRPSIVYSPWLQRKVHCMSVPELIAFILGSWLGAFIDLHEGRMLSPEPSPGFLAGCPYCQQLYLGAHCGTIEAADRLGLLKFHPLINSGSGKVAFPLLSDLLWFAQDADGIYLVNWCIKNSPDDFIHAFRERGPAARSKSDEAHQARLLTEAALFTDAKSRTVSISLRDIPEYLQSNLRALYVFTNRERTLPEELRLDFVQTCNERVQKQVPAIETITKFVTKHGGAFHDYLVALMQAIWRGEVLCDLCRPLTADVPFRPVTRDIKKIFANWCTRELV